MLSSYAGIRGSDRYQLSMFLRGETFCCLPLEVMARMGAEVATANLGKLGPKAFPLLVR